MKTIVFGFVLMFLLSCSPELHKLTPVEEEEIIDGKIERSEPKTIYDKENRCYILVQEMPQYPGGAKALMEFVARNAQYPPHVCDCCIQGRVFVRFLISETGNVDKISVVRGVDPLLDKEAMRVVSLLEGWTPGKLNGKPVPVWYIVPINF